MNNKVKMEKLNKREWGEDMLKVEKLEENQKTKNKKVQTKNKGITLIALVITIIVILILARSKY